jgi:hypothetical protein
MGGSNPALLKEMHSKTILGPNKILMLKEKLL